MCYDCYYVQSLTLILNKIQIIFNFIQSDIFCRKMRDNLYPYCLLLLLILFAPVNGAAKSSDTFVDSLKQQLSVVKSDKDKVDILIQLSIQANCRERLNYAEQALELAERSSYIKGSINAVYRIGYYQEVCAQKYPAALELYEKSLRMAREHNYTDIQFKLYNTMADCYTNMADYGRALNCYKNALELDLEKDNVIQTLGNSGVTYQRMGEYANALDNYQQAYNLLYQQIHLR